MKKWFRFLKYFAYTCIGSLIIILVLLVVIRVNTMITVGGEISMVNIRDIVSNVSGRIDKVYIKEGSYVKNGTALFKLDGSENKIRIDEMSNQLLNQKDHLAELLKEKNQLNIELENSALQLEYMQKDLADLTEKKGTYQQLYKANACTLTELRDLEKQLLYQKYQYDTLKNKMGSDKLQLPIKEQEIAIAQKELKTTQAKLKLLQDKIGNPLILSDTNGYVLNKDIQRFRDKYIEVGQTIATVGDLKKLGVTLYIPQAQMPKVKVGQQVYLYVQPLPYQKYTIFKGHITSIASNPSEKDGGSFEAKVSISGAWDKKKSHYLSKLRPGFTVEGRVVVSSRQSLLTMIIKRIMGRAS